VTSGDLVIAGGGEHARVIADAAVASGFRVVGYTDPAERPNGAGGAPWLGSDRDVTARLPPRAGGPAFVLGFGGPPAARRRVVEDLGGEARSWAVIVHPAAWVSPHAHLEPGAVVLAGAIVNAGARLGAHVIVNTGVVVEHDVVVGAHAHLAPGATVGGAARVGEDAFVGLAAAVRDHVVVGDGATVAMGAVVVADVPRNSTVMGTPARVRRRRG
jgi:acetyltransferase EpsM